VLDNHSIVLLTYLERNPDALQTYYNIEQNTGVPRGTVKHLIEWDQELAPQAPNPLFFWAERLGYDVWLHEGNDLHRISVFRRGI